MRIFARLGGMNVPYRQIRAAYTGESITVYQAYDAAIAGPAVAAQRFVAPFKRERMTWIKPSFLWMMYRCGWATKPGQERVPAVSLSREGFEWALAHSCLSHDDRRPEWAARVREGRAAVVGRADVSGLLPAERPYPLPDEIRETIGA
ncbi:DUF4291 family protein [Nonomuraea sp. NPDC050451]|uniref:DUF4291 family protein n=1 Tax=Nonomuraea sp. NPDC050451 TaxID=3364364 RepID=UPI0037A6E115